MFRFTLAPCLFFILLPVILIVAGQLIRGLMTVLMRIGGDPGPGPRGRMGGYGPRRGRGRGPRPGRQGQPDPWASSDRPPVEAEKVCPNEKCRHTNRAGANFCARCGTRLAT